MTALLLCIFIQGERETERQRERERERERKSLSCLFSYKHYAFSLGLHPPDLISPQILYLQIHWGLGLRYMNFRGTNIQHQFFCTWSSSEYFWLCRPQTLYTTTQLCCCGMKAAIDNISVNEGGCTPIKFYLQIQAIKQFGLCAVGC